MSNKQTSVADMMEQFKAYDWLASIDRDETGSWYMLYAPSADPSEDTLNEFWNDMDRLMQADDLDHVTEIANGWFVIPEDSNE